MTKKQKREAKEKRQQSNVAAATPHIYRGTCQDINFYKCPFCRQYYDEYEGHNCPKAKKGGSNA